MVEFYREQWLRAAEVKRMRDERSAFQLFFDFVNKNDFITLLFIYSMNKQQCVAFWLC